jgi:hypothetical protein
MIRYALAATAFVALGGTAHAQSITAANPAGIAAAMKGAGYTADVDTDNVGDPRITTELNGWQVRILFYGCDEQTHGGCDSVQLSTGFDRTNAMDPSRALSIAQRWRYVAVSLDDEGDPYLKWDIVTDKGIPQSVFLNALKRYGDVLESASEIIFEDE